MSLFAYLAIVLVVWVVITLPDGRLRSVVYALPIPMSIAILASPATRDGTQLLGVPLLVAFFLAVALMESRLGRSGAVLCSLAGMVALGGALNRWVELIWPSAYGWAAVLWLVGVIGARLMPVEAPTAPRTGTPGPTAPPETTGARTGSAQSPDPWPEVARRLCELGTVFLATAVSFSFGTWLGPFVVTFPYSGAPVAFLLRGSVKAFAKDFASRSILLTLFLGAFHESSRYVEAPLALAVAWAVYLAGSGLAALLRLVWSRSER
jgi:hypothetical protein